MKTLFLFLMLTSYALGTPKVPYSMKLAKDKIQVIPLHTEIDTLLVFPEKVSTILGNGLTPNIETQGSIIYQQGKVNPKTIILRHLDGRSKVLMTVMLGDEAYAFRLEPHKDPASVIRLLKTEAIPQGKPISENEAILAARPISDARMEELFRLAKEAKILKPRIPKEYAGYSDKSVSFPSINNGLRTSVARVVKFDRDKALLFFGSIRNISDHPVRLASYTGTLKVGALRHLNPTCLRASKSVISPNETISFQGVILGTVHDTPLSLENTFRLNLTKNK